MSTRLAVIGGDGIGPEVVAQGLRVLRAVLPDVETTEYDLGAAAYHRTGEVLPDGVLDELEDADAILLGAIGDPSVPPGVLERGLLLRLRFALDHHVNLRPVKLYPGVTGPLRDAPVDMVVVREGTEGPYVGNGGTMRTDTAHEVATEVSINTAYGVERVVRDAFGRAQARQGRLTLVHKTNVLVHAGGLWKRTTDRVAAEFPDVAVDYQHADAASMFFVTDPGRFDVDRHRQPVRRHPHRHRRGDLRRHRAGRERQPRRLAHQPVDVRAGARQRARHRRPGHRRPHGDRAVGRAAARAPRPRRARPRRSRPRSPPTSPTRGSAPRGTAEVGDALLGRLG